MNIAITSIMINGYRIEVPGSHIWVEGDTTYLDLSPLIPALQRIARGGGAVAVRVRVQGEKAMAVLE